MKRDPTALGSQTFDVLVIGGGIYGAWTAFDAAQRGLSVALVEQNDWGAGTSSASSKLLHGGLRYLEYLEFGLVRKALRERKRLAHLAPHRVWPLRFLLPRWQGARVGRWRLSLGLKLYDFLAGGGAPVGRSRALKPAAFLERRPELDPRRFKGGFVYGDCGTDDARLVLEVVSGLIDAGGCAVNHLEAFQLLRAGGRVQGAHLRDRLSDQAIEVAAREVVMATGPWSESLLLPSRRDLRIRLVHGSHLVLPALPRGHSSEASVARDAILLDADDGRIFFLIPWYGRTLVGTTESPFHGDPAKVRVADADVDYLLRNVRRRLPALGWTADDVVGRFAGVRTLRREPGTSATATSREWSVERPEKGLWVPVGGKLTSAREDAAQLVDRIFHASGRKAVPCSTEDRPSPWAPQGDFGSWLNQVLARGAAVGLSADCAEALAHRHGSRVHHLLDQIGDDSRLAARLHPDLPFVRAEVDHARSREMAITDQDLWRRRIPLAILGGQLP